MKREFPYGIPYPPHFCHSHIRSIHWRIVVVVEANGTESKAQTIHFIVLGIFFSLTRFMNVLKDRISWEIRTNRLVYSLGIDDKMEWEFVFYSYAINGQHFAHSLPLIPYFSLPLSIFYSSPTSLQPDPTLKHYTHNTSIA